MTPNKIKENGVVFLDTTFLAAAFIKEHPDNRKAVKLLAELMVKNCNMKTSILCIYEFLGVVKKVNNYIYGNKPLLRKLNEKLKFLKLKILFEEVNFSYKQVLPKVQEAIDNLQKGGYITFLNIDKKHIPDVLTTIESYGSAPGDAFHHAIIKEEGISCIVTENERDFIPAGLNIIRI